MKLEALVIAFVAALAATGPGPALAAGTDVVIGDIDDLSGVYSDVRPGLDRGHEDGHRGLRRRGARPEDRHAGR